MKLFLAKYYERAMETQRVFKSLLLFVLLYNKSLNDWSLGEQ